MQVAGSKKFQNKSQIMSTIYKWLNKLLMPVCHPTQIPANTICYLELATCNL